MVLPKLAARTWIGSDASRTPVAILARALGGRDLALGLGVAIALDRGAPVRGWLEACALADTVDLLATVIAAKSISPAARRGVMALGGGSAVLSVFLSRALDQSSSGGEVNAPEAGLTGHPS
jgi:hypothetical protein